MINPTIKVMKITKLTFKVCFIIWKTNVLDQMFSPSKQSSSLFPVCYIVRYNRGDLVVVVSFDDFFYNKMNK